MTRPEPKVQHTYGRVFMTFCLVLSALGWLQILVDGLTFEIVTRALLWMFVAGLVWQVRSGEWVIAWQRRLFFDRIAEEDLPIEIHVNEADLADVVVLRRLPGGGVEVDRVR